MFVAGDTQQGNPWNPPRATLNPSSRRHLSPAGRPAPEPVRTASRETTEPVRTTRGATPSSINWAAPDRRQARGELFAGATKAGQACTSKACPPANGKFEDRNVA